MILANMQKNDMEEKVILEDPFCLPDKQVHLRARTLCWSETALSPSGHFLPAH